MAVPSVGWTFWAACTNRDFLGPGAVGSTGFFPAPRGDAPRGIGRRGARRPALRVPASTGGIRSGAARGIWMLYGAFFGSKTAGSGSLGRPWELCGPAPLPRDTRNAGRRGIDASCWVWSRMLGRGPSPPHLQGSWNGTSHGVGGPPRYVGCRPRRTAPTRSGRRTPPMSGAVRSTNGTSASTCCPSSHQPTLQ